MKKLNKIIPQIIGYLLLTPGLMSVVFFIMEFLPRAKDSLSFLNLTIFKDNYNSVWTGLVVYDYSLKGGGGGGGYTSALPLYFGLMAIAGAYLIKDNSNK